MQKPNSFSQFDKLQHQLKNKIKQIKSQLYALQRDTFESFIKIP